MSSWICAHKGRLSTLLLLVFICCAVGLFVWRPQNVVWARNAHGMAVVGAWAGTDAMLANAAYWFIELRGRTLVTVAMIGGLVWFVWRNIWERK